MLPLLVGMTAALVAMWQAARYGQEAVLHLSDAAARWLTAALTFIGTAVLVFGISFAVNWICLLGLCRQIPQEPIGALLATLAVPAVLVALIATFFSFRVAPKWQAPVGMTIYTITRTLLNLLRAIEPIIIGFVLVVWVGIGPFAGVMALILNSVADLGKLFSEQVENIEEGPLEAVTATGANRIQTINFAVIPQIVPHYLAFIFYRWDINVRLSTIIGFVGGGGIGLALFRSTNLTQYQQASVMVIAIAVVVTVLDYMSSRIRRRIA
jgi:phosphonate ABC transporter permease subunit PhnE